VLLVTNTNSNSNSKTKSKCNTNTTHTDSDTDSDSHSESHSLILIPVDVISTLDFPRGKKGCAAYKKLSCQYLDSSLKSVNILVQIN